MPVSCGASSSAYVTNVAVERSDKIPICLQRFEADSTADKRYKEHLKGNDQATL